MKKFFQKGGLLFAGAMALCAFVLPATASAASWTIVGTEHTLHSRDIGYTASGGINSLVSSCGNSTITAVVDNAQTLTITTASFRACTATGPVIGDCTITTVGTNFPWRVTPTSTTVATFDGLQVDWRYEGPACALNGESTLLTGSVAGAWNQSQHEVVFTDAEGLVFHRTVGLPASIPITIRGTFRDTTQTLGIVS